jgi:hypothetical protein
MTSESSTTIDKRIISKLLLTYFERNGSRDVLTLMARMLVSVTDGILTRSISIHRACVYTGQLSVCDWAARWVTLPLCSLY